MKIKRLNENHNPFDYYNNYDDNIKVKITFSGDQEIDLKRLKESEYYKENYSPDMTAKEIDSLIYYSVERYIYDQGLGGYSCELEKDGKEVDISLYLDTDKYNL